MNNLPMPAKRTRNRKKLTTAKIGLYYMFASCTVVQIYSMVAMWVKNDLSALYALIGVSVGEAITYCSYAAKAAKENTKGGITYEAAMREQETPQEGPKG